MYASWIYESEIAYIFTHESTFKHWSLGRVLKPRTWREHASISIPLLDFSRIKKDFSLVLQVMWFGVAFGTLVMDTSLNSKVWASLPNFLLGCTHVFKWHWCNMDEGFKVIYHYGGFHLPHLIDFSFCLFLFVCLFVFCFWKPFFLQFASMLK